MSSVMRYDNLSSCYILHVYKIKGHVSYLMWMWFVINLSSLVPEVT